LVTGIFYCNFI